jgi:hypothetical protein
MLTKFKLLAAAALILGAASAAQAANDNQSRSRGGYDIGPLGQCFVPPDCGQEGYRHRSGANGFAYVPADHYGRHRAWRRDR